VRVREPSVILTGADGDPKDLATTSTGSTEPDRSGSRFILALALAQK